MAAKDKKGVVSPLGPDQPIGSPYFLKDGPTRIGSGVMPGGVGGGAGAGAPDKGGSAAGPKYDDGSGASNLNPIEQGQVNGIDAHTALVHGDINNARAALTDSYGSSTDDDFHNPYSKFAQLKKAIQGDETALGNNEAAGGTMYDGSALAHKSNLDYSEGARIKGLGDDFTAALAALSRQDSDADWAGAQGKDAIDTGAASRPQDPMGQIDETPGAAKHKPGQQIWVPGKGAMIVMADGTLRPMSGTDKGGMVKT